VNDISPFDPSQFLDASTTEASVRRPPLPVGEYQGTLGEPKFRQTEGKKDTNLGVRYTWLDIPVTIDLTQYADLQASIGVDQVILTYSGRVDTSPSGGIDYGKGKSPGFRQIREATGLNQAGQPFTPRQLQGRVVRVRVKHEPYQGELIDNIDSVAKV
jgi:hypothetical protein